MTPRLRWTSKSLVKLSDELTEQGHEASPTMVRRLMYQAGWRLQSNNKSMAKASAPGPERPVRLHRRAAAEFAEAGQPVVSVDTKKEARRELRQRRPGMGTRRGGAPRPGPRLPGLGRGEGHSLRRMRPGRKRGIPRRRRRPRHPRLRRRLPGIMVGHPRPPPLPGRDTAAGHRRLRRLQRRPVPRVQGVPGQASRSAIAWTSPSCTTPPARASGTRSSTACSPSSPSTGEAEPLTSSRPSWS